MIFIPKGLIATYIAAGSHSYLFVLWQGWRRVPSGKYKGTHVPFTLFAHAYPGNIDPLNTMLGLRFVYVECR